MARFRSYFGMAVSAFGGGLMGYGVFTLGLAGSALSFPVTLAGCGLAAIGMGISQRY